MAEAALQETLQSYIWRRNELNSILINYQAYKNNALAQQSDDMSLKCARERYVKYEYRAMYEDSPELQEKYKDYTEIPDFEDALDKIAAELTEKQADLTSWETWLDTQITTASAELEEVNAYIESIKSMLQNNIQEDYNFGLGN